MVVVMCGHLYRKVASDRVGALLRYITWRFRPHFFPLSPFVGLLMGDVEGDFGRMGAFCVLQSYVP
jgi:hypothetical protein